jgi:16S rRNA (guanine527-N7)-methyltransferase
MEKRTRFLKDVLAQAEAPQSGEVITGRAEELAREAFLSGTFDLVTARSFGPPAVTAECAARFLKVGGTLVVSEPPDDSEVGRWNVEILAALGLKALGRVRYGAAFQILTKTKPTPKDYPRAIGTPNKLPLF